MTFLYLRRNCILFVGGPPLKKILTTFRVQIVRWLCVCPSRQVTCGGFLKAFDL
jgi:hypothetical protein